MAKRLLLVATVGGVVSAAFVACNEGSPIGNAMADLSCDAADSGCESFVPDTSPPTDVHFDVAPKDTGAEAAADGGGEVDAVSDGASSDADGD